MTVHQKRAGQEVTVAGKLPPVLRIRDDDFITTTVFVKYNYADGPGRKSLDTITLAALPNGFLQAKYNPDASDTIWLAGRNAPSRGEEFRVRLSFHRLKQKCPWRVQQVPMPPEPFQWSE